VTGTTRQALRRRLRAARRALPAATQNEHARAVARLVLTSPLVLAARRYALYAPSDGELDPSDLIDALLERHRTVALPVVFRHRALEFYRYTPRTRLQRNRYGILEPDTRTARHLPKHSIDVVFTPLVAVDRRGHRLGMGGGYYDATFGRMTVRPLLVGLAHQLQRIDRLDDAAWDIPLDAVVTEAGITAFSRRGAHATGA
jgi:5-formyltetrahydrofolate cyclo-ligase